MKDTIVEMGKKLSIHSKVAKSIAELLANTYFLYLKTQNFHWNVEGPSFYGLHKMFEEQYQELSSAVDLLAERIRALGEPAPGSFIEFNKLAHIHEEIGKKSAQEMLRTLLKDHETVIHLLQQALKVAEQENDDGSVDLITIRIEAHEKTAWMLRSSIE